MLFNTSFAARGALAASLFLSLLPAKFAFAGPDEYVLPARVEAGEREIDFKIGKRNLNTPDLNKTAYSIGYGVGVNDFWFTEVYLKYAKAQGGTNDFDAYEWENRFQLTPTGKYPVDVGFALEIESPKDRAEGYEVKWGPLFQKDMGLVQLNTNFLFQRHYRAQGTQDTEAFYQLQAKYRWHENFEFGVQGFGDLGKWNDFASSDQQGHRFGPAVFGKFRVGPRQFVKYNAAWLFGTTRINGVGEQGNTIRLQTEYEF